MLDDNFFESIGLKGIGEEQKAEITQQLTELTQNRLAMVIAEQLSEEALKQFNDIADNEGDEAAEAFLEQAIPGYEELVFEEVLAVKQAFVDDMQTLLDR
jgi:hypothetical protein